MLRLLFVISIICYVLPADLVYCSEEPLILTPYLDAGKINEAQEKARVTPDMNGVKSYSGFFTVDKECGSNMFFWFIPAQHNWEEAPVLLWLNGGPGISSLVGMFTGIGPFNHFKKLGFVDNEYHWTKNNNVIFLDKPVGTGFSFSEKGCYADTLTVVAQDVYSAILQFFTLFPNLQKNEFFLTGYSFGGSYFPAIINEIHKKRDSTSVKMNLKGLVIISPFIDRRCHHTGKFLYELGIIDDSVLESVTKLEKKLFTAIDEKNFTSAIEYDSEIGAIQIVAAGLPSYANVLNEREYSVEFSLYIRNYKVREQIHVGNTIYTVDSADVFNQLRNLYYIPANEYVQDILKSGKYIVGLISGQLNVLSPYTSVPCVLGQLEWAGAKEYLAANRTMWYVDGRLAGYFKVAGNLFEVVVRDCGNNVQIDQGKAALELITAAVSDNPGSKLLTKLDTE